MPPVLPPIDPPSPAIIGRIEAFICGAGTETFDQLARAAFLYQYQNIAALRRLCRSRGIEPSSVQGWRDVPTVPTTAFASVALHAAPPVEVFRSSGTSSQRRSTHHHPFPALYRAVVDASFPAFCLPKGERPSMLSLIPPRAVVADSSLGFMVEHVLERFGGPESVYAFDQGGVDTARATRWCKDRGASAQPAMILTTAFALVQWLDALAASGEHLSLPPASTVFETGGFKGRSRVVSRSELLSTVATHLGVEPKRVVREYGMSELTSQLYSRVLVGGDPDHLTGPPWVRARVLNPLTLEEAPRGETGLIALFDLANVGSALHLLTEDLGRDTPRGLALLGRAQGADLRGCSLTAEAMANASDRDATKGLIV